MNVSGAHRSVTGFDEQNVNLNDKSESFKLSENLIPVCTCIVKTISTIFGEAGAFGFLSCMDERGAPALTSKNVNLNGYICHRSYCTAAGNMIFFPAEVYHHILDDDILPTVIRLHKHRQAMLISYCTRLPRPGCCSS